MKIPLIFFTIGVLFVFSLNNGEVSAQNTMPGYYGGGPITISDDRNDDDLGLLLAILLLASRRGCGGGGCGGCGGGTRVVPIPYPIPFPMGTGAGRKGRKLNFKDLKNLNPIFVYDSLESDSKGSRDDGQRNSQSTAASGAGGSVAEAKSQSTDGDSSR